MASSTPKLPRWPPWPGGINYALLRTFDLEGLLSGGIINSDTANAIDIASVRPRPNANPLLAVMGDPPVHPVFRRLQWQNLSEGDWPLLEPVAMLATCFLVEPVMLGFFNGLLNVPHTRILDPELERRFNNHKLYSFGDVSRRDLNSDEKAIMAAEIYTWTKVARMSSCMQWRIGGVRNAFMITTPATLPGLHPLTTIGSVIHVHEDYLAALRGTIRASDVIHARGVDNKHALLRTRVHMAMSMVHELCHALGFASIVRSSPPPGPHPWPPEPFYGDDRISELGWAWQQRMFSGIINPIGPSSDVRCPFGLHIYDFPGAINKAPSATGEVFQKSEPPTEDDSYIDRRSAVPMTYIEALFDADFWAVKVQQYGLNALRPPVTELVVGRERPSKSSVA